MSVLSAAMRKSIAAAVAKDTEFMPGVAVRWPSQRREGHVSEVSLSFTGKHLILDAIFVRWDGDTEYEADSFCVDELHMLEIVT